MTVKGNHSIKTPPEDNINHKVVSNKVQNGSGIMIAKSPPKDSNLNHYRSDKATPVNYLFLTKKKKNIRYICFVVFKTIINNSTTVIGESQRER